MLPGFRLVPKSHITSVTLESAASSAVGFALTSRSLKLDRNRFAGAIFHSVGAS